MNRRMGDLGRKLREAMPDYYAVTVPFDAVVYKYGQKKDPMVRAPNGDGVIIVEYDNLGKPNIGDRVNTIILRDGKGKGYSFGKLLENYSAMPQESQDLQSRRQSLLDKLKSYTHRG